jgi:ubiquitin-like-conjugating enzyme ATG3
MAFNLFKNAAERFVPILTKSQFKKDGVLTPEEFVLAGDELINSCRTWQWSSGYADKKKSYMPDNKQFLITRNVPCLKRVSSLFLKNTQDVILEKTNTNEGWISTNPIDDNQNDKDDVDKKISDIGDIDDIPDIDNLSLEDKTLNSEDDICIEIEDMDAYTPSDDNIVIKPKKMALVSEPECNIIKTRSYDISITYDKYYRTPRVYLFGYDENRQPLNAIDIMEDISDDHANKTVTFEAHPHLDLSMLSIHPCKHAHLIKRIMSYLDKDVDVKEYMFIFLKLISTIIPTVEYDFSCKEV